jgi:predicted lactoylglutathione lyase
MLLVEKRFQDFARKPIGDAARTTGGILAITVDSRAEVDELVSLALASGATPAAEPQDHGFMYLRSFYDPDDHHWEVFWMDPAAVAA